MTSPTSTSQMRGFSLWELLIVLSIIAVLGTLLIPQLGNRAADAKDNITRNSLQQLREMILSDYRSHNFEQLPCPQDPSRILHPQLHYLYVNPATYALGETATWTHDVATARGWAGPYLNNSGTYQEDEARGFSNHYGETGDQTPLDGWGNPIVLQQPVQEAESYSVVSTAFARLVSAGPNGVIDTSISIADPTATEMGDDLVLFLRGQH